ncbi:Vacuolar protein-sorting-associated protein 60 [Balamuthia mandrillaris]
MRRFFGAKKPQTPAPTLTEATERLDGRVNALDEKIKKLDAELIKCRQQIGRMRPGPAQNGVKQRALKLLKQKKMYETQKDQLMGQSFNMEQAHMMTESLKDTVTIVNTLKETKATIQSTFKDIKIDQVEDLHDDLADLLEDSNEIQEILSRSYALPDEIDESDLEQELAALDDYDFATEETPSYLQDSTPSMPIDVGGLGDWGSIPSASQPQHAQPQAGRPAPAQSLVLPSVPQTPLEI